MAKGKASGHNGIPTEFFQLFWSIIGLDFHLMLRKGFDEEIPHNEITEGPISLIPKEGDLKDLNYWRPIILLTASYKVLVKILQLQLHLILRDVISLKQTTILLFLFIFDKIVLTLEILHWAKVSGEPTLFLKLDFYKAYDKISRHFFLAQCTRWILTRCLKNGYNYYLLELRPRLTSMATRRITLKWRGR